MKYLVVIVVVVVAYMMWRNARLADRAAREAKPPAPPPGAAPQDIVSCTVCGLHLPQSEAVADAKGLVYCSPEHRMLSGG